MKIPLKLLLISKVENGYRLVRGWDQTTMCEEYVAENNDTVLKLVKEHLEAHNPVEFVKMECPQTPDEH